MLPKPYRLPSHRIPIVLKSGKRMHGEFFSLILFAKQNDEVSQFAAIVPHKLSKKAALRNRAKRLLVEAIHHRLPTISKGFEVIAMARKILLTEKLQDVEPDIQMVLEKARLLKTD